MKFKRSIKKTALSLFTATSILLASTGLALANDNKAKTTEVSEETSVFFLAKPQLEDRIKLDIKKPDLNLNEKSFITSVKDYSTGVAKSFAQDITDTPKDLWGVVKGAPSKENAAWLLIGSGITLLSLTQDDNVNDYFAGKNRLGRFSEYGDYIGTYGHIGSAVLLWIGGKLIKDDKLSKTGLAGIEALLTTAALTSGLKGLTGRERPNGDSNSSFPSGHTSSSFAMATVAADMYDWDWKIAVPAYAIATFVGASRIADNKHYLSDVLGGATVGIILGKFFADHYKKKHKEQKLFIMPYSDGKTSGIELTYRF